MLRGRNEFYLVARHDAYLNFRLGTCQLPDYIPLSISIDRNLGEHFFQETGIEFRVIVGIRNDEQAAHVGTAGAHGQMVGTLIEIVVRTVLVAREQHCPVFAETAVGNA